MRISIRLTRLLVLANIFALLMFYSSLVRAEQRPIAIYSYPPPVQLKDLSITSSPLTFSIAQVTTDFPDAKELAGVVVLINWSQLCPISAVCDFSLIDQALDYWGTRQKRVILGIATVGFPYWVIDGTGGRYVASTPDWVLDNVSTMTAGEPALGGPKDGQQVSERLPNYQDPRFVRQIGLLVQKLSRYDGNATIAQLRVSVGFLAEDNAGPYGPDGENPKSSDSQWLDYCRKVTSLYTNSFKHTQLEFDIGTVAQAVGRGSVLDKAAASQFVNELLAKRIFLTFDGLQSSTKLSLPGGPKASSPIGFILSKLAEASHRYAGAGLEELRPITSPSMAEVPAMVEVILGTGVERLVVFSPTAGLLSREQNGVTPANKLATDWLDVQTSAASASQRVHTLLNGLP